MKSKDKMKTRKELEEEKGSWKGIAITFMILFFMFALLLVCVYIPNEHKLENQLSECQEQVYCSDTFGDAMSDSCVLGCIYSTKFYYDNPKIDFKESSYDCMLNCLEKAQDIQDKFSFCEVLE